MLMHTVVVKQQIATKEVIKEIRKKNRDLKTKK